MVLRYDDNGTCALTKVRKSNRVLLKTKFPSFFKSVFLQHGNDSDPFHLGNTYGGIPTNLVRQFFQESLFARREEEEEAECAKESCCD